MKVEHIQCGVYANVSEKEAIEYIRKKLDSKSGDGKFILLSNLLFSFDSSGLSDKIDLLVIGPSGLFVIEIKHWDFTYIKKNSAIVDSELERLQDKVKRVAGKLRRHSIDAPVVEGRMLLTKKGDLNITEDKSKIKGISIHSLRDWEKLLNIKDITILDDQLIEKACSVLRPITLFPVSDDIRTFCGVTNLELISPKDNLFHRVYKGIHISTRDRVILNVFDLSAIDEKNALEIAKREFEIINKLQKSPYLPRLMDSFQEAKGYQGEIYFYSFVDPSAPTLEEIALDKSVSCDERIKIAINCLQGLDELHNPKEAGYPTIFHRKLNPTNIKIKNLSTPIFTELTLAKLPDLTISPYLSGIDIDDYAAPEVKKGGIALADARSDIYSLCKSLSLLFSEENCSEASKIIKAGMTENPDERKSLRELIDDLRNLKLPLKTTSTESLPVHLWDEDRIIVFRGNYYRIVSRLGSGGIGTTFKVVQINRDDNTEYGFFVAKVISNRLDAERSLEAYKKIRSHISHPNLAFIYEIASEWRADNFAVLMKWIEGIPLSDLTGRIEVYAEEISEVSTETMLTRWLKSLCDALGRLHQAGFVHGDVTPKNIIVSGGDVVIIDYDSVKRIGSTPEIFTSLYCSPSVQNRESIDASDDIFSLAASFYHVLFNREPFSHGGVIDKEKGLFYRDSEKFEYPKLVAFFNRAVNPDKSQRFKNGYEARDFFDQTSTEERSVQQLTPQEVPWLKNILRSYPGSRYGNDETRGLDSDFAIQTYVETNLDRAILKDIRDRKVNLVILCGNAGDGKTAFLQNLAKNLGIPLQHSSKRLWDFTLPDGLRVRANLDGSASYQGRSATELLNEFFKPFIEGNPPPNLVHLLAINSGPLQAWLYECEFDSPLIGQLQDALNGNFANLPSNYRFIDLNYRSLVGNIDKTKKAITTDFLDKLIDRLLGEKSQWNVCKSCSSSKDCHIWEVVDILINQQEMAHTLKTRLYEAFQAVHQRGEIHITTRELRAALSYILFGVHYCTDIHADPDICKEKYYDRAFDPRSSHRQGELLRELTLFDPALESHPKIDRYLLGKGVRKSGMPPQYPDLTLASARRRMYFEWTDKDFSVITDGNEGGYGLARGKYLRMFRELPFKTDDEIKKIRDNLCRGISKLEDLPAVAYEYDTIPIKILPRTVTESVFWTIKPYGRFSLKPVLPDNDNYLERLHTNIELTYKYDDGSYESLILGYDLFYVLMELKDGVQLTDAASEDIFANLSIFTQRLAQEDSRQIFVWNPADEENIYCVEVKIHNGKQLIVCQIA